MRRLKISINKKSYKQKNNDKNKSRFTLFISRDSNLIVRISLLYYYS